MRALAVVVVVAAAAAAVVGTQLAKRKSPRHVSIKLQPVAWATTVEAPDVSTLARGKYLFNSRGCAECHGVNGAGCEFVNDGKGMRLKSPNISPGQGSVVARYTPEDWARTVRHCVKPDGRPAFLVPSEDYNGFTEQDLGAMVSYARSLPSEKGSAAVVELSLPVKVMYGYGAIEDAAQKINHSLPPPQPIAEGVTAAHGAYVANMCIGCHSPGLSGGKIPGTPPDWAPAANLTPEEGSALDGYPDVDQFVAMLRSGKRPDGTAVTVMPFESLRELNDTDAKAVYAYLEKVLARPFGQR